MYRYVCVYDMAHVVGVVLAVSALLNNLLDINIHVYTCMCV